MAHFINQTNKRFYPSLVSIVDTDQIPDYLGFIKQGIINSVNNLFYKDFQFSEGKKGDFALYRVEILTKNRIAIEILSLLRSSCSRRVLIAIGTRTIFFN